jgi:hypothetical protein
MPPLCINHLMQSAGKSKYKLKTVYESINNLTRVVEPIVDKADHNSNNLDSYKYYNLWMTLPPKTNAIVIVEEEYEVESSMELYDLVHVFQSAQEKVQSKDETMKELEKVKCVKEKVDSSERSMTEKRRLLKQLSDLEDELTKNMKQLDSSVRYFVFNPEINGRKSGDTFESNTDTEVAILMQEENPHDDDERIDIHCDNDVDDFISSYCSRLKIAYEKKKKYDFLVNLTYSDYSASREETKKQFSESYITKEEFDMIQNIHDTHDAIKNMEYEIGKVTRNLQQIENRQKRLQETLKICSDKEDASNGNNYWTTRNLKALSEEEDSYVATEKKKAELEIQLEKTRQARRQRLAILKVKANERSKSAEFLEEMQEI